MNQWEIYKLDLPNLGPHYVVVISSGWVCSNRTIKAVNVLLCATVRTGDRLSEYEEGLHDAEGLDFLTGCQCHSFLTIAKSRFDGVPLTGVVAHVRREGIKRKIRAAFGI